MEGSALSPEAARGALVAAYAALNRGDVEGFLALFDPDIERIEPADFPGEGVYRGIEAVRAHVAFHRGTWAEGGCEPRRFTVAGDRVVVRVEVRVRLRGEAGWREGVVGDVFTFRGGRVVRFRTFRDEQEALAWAGVAPDARGGNR